MPYGMWPPAFRWWGDEEEPAEETKGKALEVGGGQIESLYICDLYTFKINDVRTLGNT